MSHGKRSRRKGATGDREARKMWEDAGFGIIKWSVGLEGPDFIGTHPKSKTPFSVEVTRDATRCPPANYKNLDKAAKSNLGIPVALTRRDRMGWLATFYAKDILDFVTSLLEENRALKEAAK